MLKNLGLMISQYRNMKNLTQEKLSDLVGVSRQAIVNWEENKSITNLLNFVKFREALEIPFEILLGKGKKYEIIKETDLEEGYIAIFARQIEK